MLIDLHIETEAKDWAAARQATTSAGNDGRVQRLVPPTAVQKILLHALLLGFDGFALSLTVDGSRLHKLRPFHVDFDLVAQQVGERGGGVQSNTLRPSDPAVALHPTGGFLHALRLTIETSSMEHLVQLTPSSMICKFYDVIAVKPGSQEEFAFLCTESQSVDVICIDTVGRLPFDPKLKEVDAALKRGISFEICIASALRDPKTKRHLIANASKIIRLTRGRHVVLSSGAREWLECRSPHDLANLGVLMGMNYEQSKNARPGRRSQQESRLPPSRAIHSWWQQLSEQCRVERALHT